MRDSKKGGALTEVTLYILLALFEPRHGYAVMQFIEQLTDKRLSLGAGTLYGALISLQEKGWIVETNISNKEDKKKHYQITDEGQDEVNRELVRLKELLENAQNVVGGRHNE